MHSRTFVLLALVAVAIWRLYVRTRRLIGRQRFSPTRPWISACLFPLLLLALAAGSAAHPAALAALAGGSLAGAALGIYGLRRTQFEHTEAGLFYRPSAHIGVALSLLVTVRILYRIIETYPLNPIAAGAASSGPAFSSAIASGPLTLAAFGTLAGYYLTYAVGLLRWQRRVRRGAAEATQSLTK